MPDKLEKYAFVIVQLLAVVWWFSALSTTVDRQDELIAEFRTQLNKVDNKVDSLENKMIRVETQLNHLNELQDSINRLSRELNAYNVQ